MTVKKDITIYDIATQLNLSSSTVSRALQNYSTINIKTRRRVQQAAIDLGYRYNTLASNLRQQRTNTIGVMVHELNSTFMASVLAGIEKVTSSMGFSLIIAHSSESHEKEVENALTLFDKRVDGVLVSLALDTNDLNHFKRFEEKGIPVVFFDRVEEKSSYIKVVIDNYKCGYQATQHLIEQGCKKIALVTSNLGRNVYSQRHLGYADALYDNDISLNEDYLFITDLSEQSGVQAAENILKMNPIPDGAFITNDFTAAVCMQTFKGHGIRVPEDIAVVGFNNDAIGKYIDPTLTTVDYPGIDIGEIAARNLVSHLKGLSNIHYTDTIVIRSNLIVRKSSLRKG